jgi:hypothetical protein
VSCGRRGILSCRVSRQGVLSWHHQCLGSAENLFLKVYSAKGHSYSCEVFNLVIKLSSAGWGRIQPTGNVILEKGCVKLSLYDPGLMMTHSGEYCGK